MHRTRQVLAGATGTALIMAGAWGLAPARAEVPSVCIGAHVEVATVGPVTPQVATNRPCPQLPASDPNRPCPGWLLNTGTEVNQPPVNVQLQACVTDL